MEDRLLEAVGEGHVTLRELETALDADAGALFLASRRLTREGLLAEIDPLCFRLTEAGEERVERDRPDRSVPGSGTASEADVDESEAVSATGNLADDEGVGTDHEHPGIEPGRTFDFAATYAAARDADSAGPRDDDSGTTTVEDAEGPPPAGTEADTETDDEASEAETAGGEQTGDDADEAGDGRPVTAVEGVSEAYAERLREAGVETASALDAADPMELSDATGIAASRIQRWQS